jgi:hypothetical protein
MEALSRRWSKARTRHHIRDLARPDRPSANGGAPAHAPAPRPGGALGSSSFPLEAEGADGGKHAAAAAVAPRVASAPAAELRGSEAALAGASRLRLVERTFQQLFPQDFHAVVPVYDHRRLVDLLRAWDKDLQGYIQGRALLARKAARRRASAQRASGGGRGGSGGGDAEAGRAGTAGEGGGEEEEVEEDEEGGCCANRGLPCWRPVMPRAEALDNQRQALLALEAQIIAAQQEVRLGVIMTSLMLFVFASLWCGK